MTYHGTSELTFGQILTKLHNSESEKLKIILKDYVEDSVNDHLDSKTIMASDLIVEMLKRGGAYYNSFLCKKHNTNYIEIVDDEVVGDGIDNQQLPMSIDTLRYELECYKSETYSWRKYLF